jgi:hypothetical protein
LEIYARFHCEILGRFCSTFQNKKIFCLFILCTMEYNLEQALPLEMLRLIFSLIEDITTYRIAIQVNHFWKREIEAAWRSFCQNK